MPQACCEVLRTKGLVVPAALVAAIPWIGEADSDYGLPQWPHQVSLDGFDSFQPADAVRSACLHPQGIQRMDAVIDHRSAHELADHFKAISKVIPLKPVRSDADAGDENHVLADLAATLDELIADYDDRHHHLPVAGPVELLRFLMNEHDLKQIDLAAEVGSQGVVSEILHGKRALNLRQMRALAQRFGVPVAAFVDPAQDVAA